MPKLFTDEQIEQARSVRLEDYLRSYEPGNITVRECYDEIRLKDHDSFVLTISNDIFHWKSHSSIGGKGALDYLVKVRNYDFKEAVCMLLPGGSLNLSYTSAEYKPEPEKPVERKPFELPPRSDSTNSTVKYLQGRGIDISIINECIRSGSIYQTMFYSEKAKRSFPNTVFVGYDWSINGMDGVKKARFACIRSTFGDYKQDVTGSNKAYNFLLPASKEACTVSVFESAIDVLSGATLAKKKYRESYKNIHRLSLGGVSDLALKNFLETFSNVHTVNLCLDNDVAGCRACKEITQMLRELGKSNDKAYKVNVLLPKLGKDYNEMLLAEISNCGVKSKEDRLR